ncbi:MAG: ACT domain-containing protein [Oscillospiraceae bacterium]|nr:ACT domain-containing protein [Oscillospiraceae bacterium]
MIKQISVFLENKVGRLEAMLNILADAEINIRAMTISEDDDNGTVRLIVNNPEKAEEVLTANNFVVRTPLVIGVTVRDEPGAVRDALKIMSENKINIRYLYPLVGCPHGNANILVRVKDTERSAEILKKAGVKLFTQADLS